MPHPGPLGPAVQLHPALGSCAYVLTRPLRYTQLFKLEHLHPLETILERASASGITVHQLDGRYVLKGRCRQAAYAGSNLGAPISAGESLKVGSAP